MTVRFLHIRTVDDDMELQTGGGVTIAYTDLEKKELMFQIAMCNDCDNFNYDIGRKVAQGRLQSQKHNPYMIPYTDPPSDGLIAWVQSVLFGGQITIFKDQKNRLVYNQYESSDLEDVPEVKTEEEEFQTQFKAEVPPVL